jgi:riboflavin kinase/FMN adenylyltransferase
MSETLSIGELPVIGPAVLTMGVFDGVHLGHRAMLEATGEGAQQRGSSSVVLVFDPHPEEVLRPGIAVPYLAPLDANLERIRSLGIDHALPIRFDTALRELSAEAFLDALGRSISLRGLVMSPESAFGQNRSGTVERMRELGVERGFDVISVAPTLLDGLVVSSSRLRAAIANGDVTAARRMGAEPYLEGRVVHGDGRGRELGFPTANLAFDYLPVMPARGVYAAFAKEPYGGAGPAAMWRAALVSIGVRPTFASNGAELVETHLLDYSGNLYGHRLGVVLVARLRGERRFESAAALVAQMRRDEVDARKLLADPRNAPR